MSALRVQAAATLSGVRPNLGEGRAELWKVIVAIIGLGHPTDFQTPGAVAQPVRAGDS